MGQQVQQHVPQSITYNQPRRPAWHLHMAAGVFVAVLGFLMFMVGALAMYAMVTLIAGVLYCGVALIIAMVQGHGTPPMEFPPADRDGPTIRPNADAPRTSPTATP